MTTNQAPQVTITMDPEMALEQGQEFCMQLEQLTGPFYCFICDGTGDLGNKYPGTAGQCPVCKGTGKAPLAEQERYAYRVLNFHNFYP
jgi:hypothetical protein